MKPSFSKIIVASASLAMFAAIGTRAQDQHPDPVVEGKVLQAWTPPHVGRVASNWSNDVHGSIYISDFDTDRPYLDTLKFYAGKYNFKAGVENLDKAAAVDSGNRGMSGDGISFATANRPDALAATFVGIFPTHSVTVALYRPVNQKRTHVTVTRVDPQLNKRP